MGVLGKVSRWFDLFQRRHAALAFLLAVRQKYSEDQGGYLAATLAYYAFFSLLPLLLLLITGLGYALSGDPACRGGCCTRCWSSFRSSAPSFSATSTRFGAADLRSPSASAGRCGRAWASRSRPRTR